MAAPYEIIGTRPDSAFRVPSDYFERKPKFAPGVDPTTGGPCRVVEPGTDTPVPGAAINRSHGPDQGRVTIEAPA